MNMKISKLDILTKEEFKDIVLDSFSISEVTRKCGFRTWRSGGGRERVIQRIKNEEVDISHFKVHGRQHEKPPVNKIKDYKTVLKKGSNSHRITVKNILMREKLVEYRCVICGNEGMWNEKELSLQLHHIDGDTTNNEVDNLTFLCPNCHSQTDNYAYKNAKHGEKKRFFCSDCGKEISKYTRNGKCRICASKSRIINIPLKDELIKNIKEIKFKKYICFYYGVSEKTLEKWLDFYKLPKHISEFHRYINENNL